MQDRRPAGLPAAQCVHTPWRCSLVCTTRPASPCRSTRYACWSHSVQRGCALRPSRPCCSTRVGWGRRARRRSTRSWLWTARCSSTFASSGAPVAGVACWLFKQEGAGAPGSSIHMISTGWHACRTCALQGAASGWPRGDLWEAECRPSGAAAAGGRLCVWGGIHRGGGEHMEREQLVLLVTVSGWWQGWCSRWQAGRRSTGACLLRTGSFFQHFAIIWLTQEG